MPAPVYLSELLDAFLWVNAARPLENAAYVSRESGRIHWHTESGDFEEELPEGVDDETLYASVPHKRDLDLEQGLVFRFVEARIPDAYDQVRQCFSRRGAHGRFRDILERRDLLGAWHAYEQQACEAALREWAESEDLHVVETQRVES